MQDRRNIRYLSLFSVCLGITGCNPNSTWSPSAKKNTPATAAATASNELSAEHTQPTIEAVQMSFDILRVEFPLESARHSLKVWNHADRNCLDARTVARLSRNGLRVGIANPEAWPAVQTILTASKARIEPQVWEGSTGLPVVAALGTISEPETIFSYGDAGRLNGKTFSAGQKLMQLDYAVLAQSGGAVETRLSFEVRHDRGEMTWESSGGVVRQVPAYDRHLFDDLTATLLVPPGTTLVIGPDERAAQEYLVGARFLEWDRDAAAFEAMYFITPKPSRAAIKNGTPRSPPVKDKK